MAELPVVQLNAILADVWSLVRLMRKLGTKVEHPGAQEALKRVRMDCSAHCATLSGIIRSLGAGPVDQPGSLAKQVEAIEEEPQLWSLLDNSCNDIDRRIPNILPSFETDAHRDALTAIQQNLQENRLWLKRVA